MPGKITRVSITYTYITNEGPQHRFYGLDAMTRHPSPERARAILDDLEVFCREVQAQRNAAGSWDRLPDSAEPSTTAQRVPNAIRPGGSDQAMDLGG
jgi:hypothetical protein